MIRVLVEDAYRSLTSKPGRTIGMLLGIVLGAASAVATIVTADTQQEQVNKRFDLQRSSVVVVRADGLPPSGFAQSALDRLRRLTVVASAGELSIWQSSTRVAATPLAPAVSLPLLVADRGGLAASHARSVSGVSPDAIGASAEWVWLGHEAARRLGIRPDTPADIVVGGRSFTVAGEVAAGSAGFAYLDSGVIMSRPAAADFFGDGENVRAIARVRPGSAQRVGAYAVAALDPARSVTLTDATPPDGQVLLGNVTRDLRMVGLALGGVIGLLGVLGISNTMTSAVHQRTREIGLRAALGWSGGRIATLILLESMTAGLVAGLIGCGAGLAAAWTWSALHHWNLVVLPTLPLLAIGGSLAASAAGGLAPALRAASVSPLTAMRS